MSRMATDDEASTPNISNARPLSCASRPPLLAQPNPLILHRSSSTKYPYHFRRKYNSVIAVQYASYPIRPADRKGETAIALQRTNTTSATAANTIPQSRRDTESADLYGVCCVCVWGGGSSLPQGDTAYVPPIDIRSGRLRFVRSNA